MSFERSAAVPHFINTFKINEQGRPEGTSLTDKGYVVHYTCNSPSETINEKAGIISIGNNFNVGENEVLLIPEKLFKGTIGTVEAEALMRDLSKKK
jgi:hypothetical protein